ncbi:hypothetical protein ACMFMG_001003 [Clarireedia jacksonii]
MVENFEVVLASGEIVNANANSNSDLWTALKGGGNNFGIVTRFDIRTFQQGKQWDGLVVYPITTLDEHWKALEDTAPAVFRVFMEITPQYRNTMKITTLSETAKDAQKLQTSGIRQIFVTTSFCYSVEGVSDDEYMNETAKEFIEDIDRLSSNAGLFNPYKYVNYAASYQDPISGRGYEIKAKLQAVSNKYDPGGFFQINAPGGFKISSKTG